MDLIQQRAECPVCGERILVELTSNGTMHQSVAAVIHAHCVRDALAGPGKAWADANPETAEELQAWADNRDD